MLVSPIPPIPELNQTYWRGDPFHLVLSHLLVNQEYRDFYTSRGREGDYLVLDNGAHENNQGQPLAALMRAAVSIGASELAVPDVLFNMQRTVLGCKDTLGALSQNTHGCLDDLLRLDAKLMLVPQGRDYKEWKQCLEAMLRLHSFHMERKAYRHKPVIGVSKDYAERFEEGLRTAFIADLEPRQGEIEVHCLGWPKDLWSLGELAEEFPWIRSTDSARAFVYALSDIPLAPFVTPKYPGRRLDYFTTELTESERGIASGNLSTYRYLAGAK